MGELILTDQAFFDGSNCEVSLSNCDFGLSLYVDNDNPLDKQLLKTEEMQAKIDEYISFGDLLEEVDNLEVYRELRNNPKNLWNNVSYIKLCFENIDELEFIKNNKNILSKKIVINEFIDIIDLDKVLALLDKFHDYRDIIYVGMVNNFEYVSLSECYQTIMKIKNISDYIMSKNLSPVELIMYTYDIVRNRVYKQEENGEKSTKSRDLSGVLSGRDIVCVGYANILEAILKYCNITSFCAGLTDKNNEISGHERNIIYVKDDKYNIDGVYYFDTTWDSKTMGDENEYLNGYLCFAKTRLEMETYEKRQFIYDECPYYFLDLPNKIKELLDHNELEKCYELYYKSIKYMTRIIGKKIIDSEYFFPILPKYNQFDHDKFVNDVLEVIDYFNRPLSAETYLLILNNVRKIEYYDDPDTYLYDFNTMFKICIQSDWKFKNDHLSKEQQIMKYLFNQDIKQTFINYVRQEELPREILETRLTKVLLNIRNKKS